MSKQFFYILIFIIITLLLLQTPFIQRFFIYYPLKSLPNPQHFAAQDMQSVMLSTQDGLELHAWYHPPKVHYPNILYLPGNAGHRGYRMNLARHFINAGFGILLVDYRGYGGNPGRPNEQGLYADARAGMAFLNKQSQSIIIYGESIGTGVAIQMATEFPICSLILQSPFTSFTALKQYIYPWIPIFIYDKYDSLRKITSIHVPILIVHGKKDKIVPYRQSMMLFEHANQPKKLVSFADKGHNNLWDEGFIQTILKFTTDQKC